MTLLTSFLPFDTFFLCPIQIAPAIWDGQDGGLLKNEYDLDKYTLPQNRKHC